MLRGCGALFTLLHFAGRSEAISNSPPANNHWHRICLQEEGNATCSSREGELSYLKGWDVHLSMNNAEGRRPLGSGTLTFPVLSDAGDIQ